MKIGYNKIWGIVSFMPAGLVCCLTAASVRTEESVPVYLAGTFWMFILFGILFLTRTYVEINQGNVFIKPLIGFGTKTYPVRSAKDFSVEGKDVFVMSNGVRQRLPVSAWLVDPGGWTSLIKWIETTNWQTGRTLDEASSSSS